MISLEKQYRGAVLAEAQAKQDGTQTKVAYAAAKVEAAKEETASAKKLTWMEEDVKIKGVKAKESDLVVKDAYKAYKEAKTQAERAATIKKVGPATAKNEKALEDLQDAKDALEAYEIKRKGDLTKAKYTADQMLEETKRAEAEYEVTKMKSSKLGKRREALKVTSLKTHHIWYH